MSNVRVINGPHLRTERTTRQIMMYVTLSLIPALFGAVYFFGIRALYLAGLSVTICVLTEYLWQKLTKKQVTAGDFSAVVTGLLIVYNMPVTVPVWALAAADVFAIIFVKQMFGGIGNNFVNPALMGRLLIMIDVYKRQMLVRPLSLHIRRFRTERSFCFHLLRWNPSLLL